MSTNSTTNKWASGFTWRLLAFIVPVLMATASWGQSSANYSFTTNTTGSMALDMNGNTIDMTTGTTTLVVGATDDSPVSAVTGLNLGSGATFNFTLMGINYSQFSTNPNGWMGLGATQVPTGTYVITGSSLGAPRLSACVGDLKTFNPTIAKVVGTAPNRCLVVEFSEQSYYLNAATNDFTYQVRFYETTNVIEYVYGSMVVGSAPYASGYQIGWYTNGTTANTYASVNPSTNTVSTTATTTTTSWTAATAVPNLHSISNGSRRVYRWTPPPAPTAPTDINFTAVGGTTTTVNWTDATGETGYNIYYSTNGGTTYTLVTSIAANSTSYAATGLNYGTTYTWKVEAYNEGAVASATGSQATTAGTLSGTMTVGSGGTYATLTAAFAAITASGLSGNLNVQIISGYVASAETFPIAGPAGFAVGPYNVTVYPTTVATPLTISGTSTTGIFNFGGTSGTRNVIFDGRVNATGSTSAVTITNTSATAGYAFNFANEASGNTLRYLTIRSANQNGASGTILFGGTTGLSGNDNNTITNCDILDNGGFPYNAIYSSGTSLTADNSGNSVTNCNIANFFAAGAAFNGMNLAANNSAWTITGNKFYQTASRTVTSGITGTAIWVQGSNSGGYTISNNTVGFNNAAGTGTMTFTSTSGFRFNAFILSMSATQAVNNIQGNTIAGISITSSSGGTLTVPVFGGIMALSGNFNIGNTTANTIGSMSATGSITVTQTTTSITASALGIYCSTAAGGVGSNVSGNNVGGITNGPITTVGSTMYGIYVTGAGSINVQNNTIGGTVANSLQTGISGTTAVNTMYGIQNLCSGLNKIYSNNIVRNMINYSNGAATTVGISNTTGNNVTINNNTVSNISFVAGTCIGVWDQTATAAFPVTMSGNLVHTISNTYSGTSSVIFNGIRTTTSNYSITASTVRDITIGTTGTAVINLFGITNASTGAPTESITNNTIYNLTANGTSTAATQFIAGIYCNSTSSVSRSISGNTIYAINYSGSGSANMFGIITSAGISSTVSNVFKNKIYDINATTGTASSVEGIRLGNSAVTSTMTNNIIGRLTAAASTAAPAVYGITIIGGTTVNAYNNTVYIAPTLTGAGGAAGLFVNATPGSIDLRNNIFVNKGTSATGRIVGFWKSSTSLTNIAATSNRNIYFAGTPGANNLIFWDGTNAYSNLVTYRSLFTSGAEQNAGSEDVPFLNVATGSGADFLHVATTLSFVEANASSIATVTDDFDGQARNGSTPDIGADEISGTVRTLAAPTSFSTTTQTVNSYTLNWTDASNGEQAFAIYRATSVGGPYTLIGSVLSTTVATTGTGYTYNETGLQGNSTYYYQIYAVNIVSSPALTGNASTNGCGGGLTGTKTVGPTGDFASLSLALSSLQSAGLDGPLVLELQSDYVGSAVENFPISFTNGIGCLNSTNTLAIQVASGVSTPITLSSTTANIFNFDNASYITIDGRPGATGSSRMLVLESNNAATNVIYNINESSNNTFRYLEIKSGNTFAATNSAVTASGTIPGAVVIGTTSGLFGNDNITISNCAIRPSVASMAVGIYSGNATTTGSAANNDNLSITDNEIYDFFTATSNNLAAINIAAGVNATTITGNSIYMTSTKNFLATTPTVRGIWITPVVSASTFGSGNVITGNFIGGSAASTGSTAMTLTGTAGWLFYGMDVSVGTGTATSIQGNTIKNLNLTNATTSASFGIMVANGNVNVGNTTGNVIGAATGTGSITYTTTTSGGAIIGIRSSSNGTMNISNNTIGSIDLNGVGTNIAPAFMGISVTGTASTNTVNNNTIGSLSTANSIKLASTSVTATTGTAVCYGINVAASTSTASTNNKIANISNNVSSTSGASPTSAISYSSTTSGTATVTGNTIRNISSSNYSTGNGSNCAIVAINMQSNAAGINISGNTIHSLTLSNTVATSNVYGLTAINYNAATTGTNVISKNFIHSFKVDLASVISPMFTGMDVGAGTLSITNNMMRLGVDASGASVAQGITIRGISDNASITNVYHNSIYIGGTVTVASTNPTYCYHRFSTSGLDDVKNNLFSNVRSNSGSTGKHYAVNISGTANIAMNYNNYYGTGTGYVFANNGADVAALTSGWIAGDVNSYNFDPQFENATGNSNLVNLHISASNASIAEATGTGTLNVAVADDFDNEARSGVSPVDMGADAGDFNSLLCQNTPAAGTASASSATICNSGAVNLALTTTSLEPGISYQWRSSTTSASGPFSDILGATNLTYTSPTLNQTTYFVVKTSCINGGGVNTSSVATVTVNTPSVASTTAGLTCGAGTVNLSATVGVGNGIKWYAASTGGAALASTSSYTTPSITATTTYYAEGGLSQIGPGTALIGAGGSTIGTTTGGMGITPFSGYYGSQKTQYLLRADLLQQFGLSAGNITAMNINVTGVGTSAVYNGYTIKLGTTTATAMPTTAYLTDPLTTVYGPTAYPAVSTTGLKTFTFASPFNWDGTSSLIVEVCFYNTGFTQNATVEANSALSYNAVYGSYADGADQCSTPTGAKVTSTSLPRFQFVGTVNNYCASTTRTPVIATVTTPPALSVTANQTVCNDAVAQIDVTSTIGDYATYAWSPTTNLFTDAAGTTAYTGTGDPTTVYVRSNVGNTYTYTLTASNPTPCVTTTTSAVTVRPFTTASISASINPVCANTPSVLTSNVAAPGSVVVGAGGTTQGGSGLSPFAQFYGGQRTQYLVLASSLTSAGLQAGNLSSLTFNVTSGVSTLAFTNYTVKIKQTSTSNLTAAETGTFTTVYGPVNLPAVTAAGNITLPFSTPINWNGTSNLVIEVCFDNGSSYTSNSTVTASTTAYTSVWGYYADGTTMCGTTAGANATSTALPVMTFIGNKATTPTTYTWNDGTSDFATGGAAFATRTVSPSSTTNYTVTALVNACPVVSPAFTLNVNPVPSAPTASAAPTQCGYGVPTVAVTSTSGAGTPNFVWYNAATAGTALQTSTSTTYTTPIATTTSFYVTEKNSFGCESTPRTQADVNVTQPDAVALSGDNKNCVGSANTLTVSQTGNTNSYVYTWTATPSVGSGVSGTPTGASQSFAATAFGTYIYRVIATDASAGCVATDSVAVQIYQPLTGTAVGTDINSCSNLTGLVAVNVSGSGTVVNNDFSSATLPANMTIAGNDVGVVNGRLRFTSANASKNGGVLITNPTGLANNDFQIDFDMRTTSGSGSPADGFSYSYGPDVVALPTGLGSATVNTVITDPGATNPENGSGSALKLAFDAYTNGANLNGVYLMYNSVRWNQSSTNTAAQGLISYTPDVSWRATSTQNKNTHVTIKIDNTGKISMWLNNSIVVQNEQLPASYLTADKSTWKHAFCGRTGAEFQGHFIDNLIIQYNNFYEYSVDNGTTWTGTTPVVANGPGTYAVKARYAQVPSCNISLGNVTIAAPNTTISQSAPFGCTPTNTFPTLTLDNAWSDAVYQWQGSASGANSFSDIVGTTGTTFTPSGLTSDYDYRTVATCAGSSITYGANSPTAVVTVYNPSITSSTPASACGVQPVTLGATGSTGTTVRWYDVANGGALLTSGTSYTTPNVTANTNYYAQAVKSIINPTGTMFAGTGGTTTSATAITPFSQTWGSQRTQYLLTAALLQQNGLLPGNISKMAINVTSAVSTLTFANYTIKIGTTSATTMTAAYLSDALTTVYGPSTYPAVTSTGLASFTFATPFSWDGVSNLVMEICYSNGLSYTSNSTVDASTVSYTSTFGRYIDGDVCGATVGTAITASSILPRFQFTGNVESTCSSNPRTVIVASYVAPPALTLSAATTDLCLNATTAPITITAPSPTSTYTSYTWSPNTNVTGNETSGYQFNPTTSTTYTLTATSATCINSTTEVITVRQLPTAVSASANIASICPAQGVSTLTATGGTTGGSSNATVSGTSPAASTGVQLPFYRTYEGSRKQILVTAAELNALGITSASTLSSLSMSLSTIGAANNNFDNLTIRMMHTSLGTLSTFVAGSPTTVYTSASYTATLGANVFTFSTPFAWNGTDNIIVDWSFDNDVNNTCSAGSPVCWGNTYTQGAATTATTSVVYHYSDNSTGARDMKTITTVTGTSAIRSLMTFAYSTVVQNPITWTPNTSLFTNLSATTTYNGTDNAPAVYASPTASTAYTAIATSAFGCTTASSPVSITTYPKPVITAPATATVCSNTSTNVVVSTNVASNISYNVFSISGGIVGATAGSATGATSLTIAQTLVNPSYTATGTVTYQIQASSSANGCISAPVFVTVTVQPAVNMPTASNATQCAAGTPFSTVTSAQTQTNHIFGWYDAISAGTQLQVSPNASTATTDFYLSSISATTDFYVAEQDENTACWSDRTLVTAYLFTSGGTFTNGANPVCSTIGFDISLQSPPALNDITYKWYLQLDASNTFNPTGWGAPVSTTSSYSILNQSDPTWYFGEVTCNTDNITVSSTPLLVSQKNAFLCNYCQPTGGICGGASKNITGVQVKANALNIYLLSNLANGCSSGGYGTFSANNNDGISEMATLYKSYAYTLEVTPFAAATYVSAWIDFNIDGDYLDAGEQIVTNQLASAASVQSYTFIVPSTYINLGNCIMRVRSSASPITNSCATSVGETEDYVIKIDKAPNPLNDNIFGPAPLPVIAVNYLSTPSNATNATATTSANIAGSGWANNTSYKDVWYQCTVPATGVVYINVLPGTLTNADMQVWESSNNQFNGTLTSLGTDDNSGVGNMPFMRVATTPGKVLFIQVRSNTATIGGTFTIAATFGVNWRGTISTNWSTSGNWYNDMVPASNYDVVIPVTTNVPTITTASTINSVFAANGVNVVLNQNLTFTGNLSLYGAVTATSQMRFRGAAELINAGTANSILSNVIVGNFTQQSGTLTIDATNGRLNVADLLKPEGGSIVTNNRLVIRSYNSGTVNTPLYLGTGQIALGAGTFTGDVVIERKIPASTYTSQHYVSAPITSTTNTLSNNYNDDYSVVGAPYPFQYTGLSPAPQPTVWPSSWWYDASLTSFSVGFRWMNGSGKAMTPGMGVSINVAGNTVIDVQGAPVQTDIAYSVVSGQGNLVGNPYPSTIDLDKFIGDNSSNIGGNTVYYNKLGATVSYSTLGGGTSVPDVFGDHRERFMAHSSGFWVNATNGVLLFNNTQREYRPQTQIAGALGGTFYSANQGANSNNLRIRVKDASNSTFDEMLIAKDANTQDGIDNYDASKFMMVETNPQPYIYSVLDGQNLVINAMPNVEGKEIPVGVVTTSAGKWTISVHNSDAFVSEASTLVLEDRSTGIFYNLKNTPEVTFDMPEGNVGSRFYIHVGNATTSVKGISAASKGVSIYSNSDKLFVNFGTELKGSTTVEVYNLTGQLMTSVDATSFKGIREVNMNNAAAGNYLVKVVNGSNVITDKVFIDKK